MSVIEAVVDGVVEVAADVAGVASNAVGGFRRWRRQRDAQPYRQHVIAMATGHRSDPPSRATMEAAGVFPPGYEADLKRLRSRLKAVADLETADRLEKEAAAIIVPPPESHAERRLETIQTIGELARLLDLFKAGTVIIVPEAERQQSLRQQVSTLRSEANWCLTHTCDPSFDAELRKLADEMSGAQNAAADEGKHRDRAAEIDRIRDKLFNDPGISTAERQSLQKRLGWLEDHTFDPESTQQASVALAKKLAKIQKAREAVIAKMRDPIDGMGWTEG